MLNVERNSKSEYNIELITITTKISIEEELNINIQKNNNLKNKVNK